jgi:hypothetical protein
MSDGRAPPRGTALWRSERTRNGLDLGERGVKFLVHKALEAFLERERVNGHKLRRGKFSGLKNGQGKNSNGGVFLAGWAERPESKERT